MNAPQSTRKPRKPRSGEARKPGPSPKWTARIELRLSPEQYEKLERIAKSQRCSRGSLLLAWINAATEDGAHALGGSRQDLGAARAL